MNGIISQASVKPTVINLGLEHSIISGWVVEVLWTTSGGVADPRRFCEGPIYFQKNCPRF